MKSSLFSALKSALGTKPKADVNRSPHPGAINSLPAPQYLPYPPSANVATYPTPPTPATPIMAAPFSIPAYPSAPAPLVPAVPAVTSLTNGHVGLTAAGMPLATPAAFKALLGFSDLRWIGLQPTVDEPEVSVEGNGVSASWTHDTDAQGGIELDLFRAADSDPARVLQSIVTEGEGTPALLQLGGADEAYEAQTDQYAWLAARRGRLVFVLSIPSSARASEQLGYLGGLVLVRVSAG